MSTDFQTGIGPGRIISLNKLTEDEIDQILNLKELCELRNDVDILLSGSLLRSLGKPGVGTFAFLKDGRIIGFVYFYSFVKQEAEAMVFADPDGDWRHTCIALLRATMAECERRGHTRLLLMNDQRFPAGAELMIGEGFKLVFSEHRMEAKGDQKGSSQNVDLCKVGNDDTTLYEMELACHGKFISKPDQTRYLAYFEGKPAGKVDVHIEGKAAELTGLCVVPEFRGKGLGRSILVKIIGIQRTAGAERIALDVRTDNDVALDLYLKSGFKRSFTIDYYEMTLEN